MLLRYITRGDIILIISMLVLSVVSGAWVRHSRSVGKVAIIEMVEKHGARRVMELSLDKDTRESVQGPLGTTIIVIEDGTVRIESSPCPNHYCIHMGRLRHGGEMAVCVPNHVIVTVESSDKDTVDGVSQ
jgi:hypothetical protein